jgi:uncharacterized Zn ribbon protein
VVKQGAKVKNIRLADGDHDIDFQQQTERQPMQVGVFVRAGGYS